MKKILSAILIFSMILSLCSCGTGANNLKISVATTDKIATLDPLNVSGDGENIIVTNCLEGLLRLNSKGDIDLAGAIAYTVDKNALVYTFKLNPKATWYVSDSVKTTLDSVGLKDFDKKITADDYIYGIKKFIESGRTELNTLKGASKYNPDTADSELGLKASDEYTLEITLEKIDPDFLYKLAVLPIFPCDRQFCETLDGICYTTPATSLCNGAYYISEVTESEAVIERNPDYNGNIQVKNKAVHILNTEKTENAISRFNDGSCDILVTSDTKKPENAEPSYSCVTGIWGIAFNCKSETGKNAGLRKILLSAIDFSKIELPEGTGKKADRIIPDSYYVCDEKYSAFDTPSLAYKSDSDAVKNLDSVLKSLEKDAVSVKFMIPIQLKNSLKGVVSAWEELLGEKAEIDLRTFDMNEYEKVLAEAEYDVAVLPLIPKKRTASGVIEAVSDTPCYYTDKKLAFSPKSDAKSNALLFSQAEKLIVENGVFVPLFFTESHLCSAENISGVYMVDGTQRIYFYSGASAKQ